MIFPKQIVLLLLIVGTATAHPTSTESLVVNSDENSLVKEEHYKESDSLTGNANDTPRITEMRVFSNVSNRFAHTVVRSKVKNFANVSKETTFSIVLPDSAFISGFVMEIDGKNYTAYVKEKEEAKKVYDDAVASGFGAAHVAVDTRDSNIFTVSVNVQPQSKAVFYLTYEELLSRQAGHYELVINIRPGQPIKQLGVEVKIVESRPLTKVSAPPLRSGNEIAPEKEELDPRANIEIINSTSAVITFAPTVERQKELAKQLGTKEDEGLAGQFVVQYDVERDPSGGEILVSDGYLVHFFAPSDLKPLPKYVVFVLDTSGSMYDRKIQQLKEAMNSILEELKPSDKFSLVEFNNEAKTWDLNNVSASSIYPTHTSWSYEETSQKLEDVSFPSAYPANSDNIDKAKSTVEKFNPEGGTNIYDALRVALHLVELERKNNGSEQLQPLIVFLTDGEPTVSLGTEQIISKISEFNSGPRKSVLFALSFGEGADKKFLQKLALLNSGFSKHIYEAADASLQLQGFYKQISSPLLANVTFKYLPEVTEITKSQFPIFFEGAELVVAAKYMNPKNLTDETDLLNKPVIGWCGTDLISLLPKVEKSVTNLQRLWAYLTIKQLLEQKEIDKNPEELKKRALDLALEHSFVTPLTSLVVVKPNDTKAVDTKSTSDRTNYPRFDSSRSYAAPGLAGPVAGFSALYVPRQVSSVASYSQAQSVALAVPEASYDVDTLDTQYFNPEFDSTTTFKKSAEETLFEDFPWLKDAVNNNGTVLIQGDEYEIGLNASLPAISPTCTNAPGNNTGNCALLKDCLSAPSFLHAFDDLVKHFCLLDKYVGVCCPLPSMP